MVPRSCVGYKEAAGEQAHGLGHFHFWKTVDFSPSLLNTPFGLGWESHLQSLPIEQ